MYQCSYSKTMYKILHAKDFVTMCVKIVDLK